MRAISDVDMLPHCSGVAAMCSAPSLKSHCAVSSAPPYTPSVRLALPCLPLTATLILVPYFPFTFNFGWPSSARAEQSTHRWFHRIIRLLASYLDPSIPPGACALQYLCFSGSRKCLGGKLAGFASGDCPLVRSLNAIFFVNCTLVFIKPSSLHPSSLHPSSLLPCTPQSTTTLVYSNVSKWWKQRLPTPKNHVWPLSLPRPR